MDLKVEVKKDGEEEREEIISKNLHPQIQKIKVGLISNVCYFIGTNLFVANFKYNTEEDELEKLFA